jgi:Uncharacterized conserved protein
VNMRGEPRKAFLVPPQEEILGICTSSATVGPSISFGQADAVTVFSRDVSLADAWATALCNRVTVHEEADPIEPWDPGIEGVLVVQDGEFRSYGHIPPLVAAYVDFDLITRG